MPATNGGKQPQDKVKVC